MRRTLAIGVFNGIVAATCVVSAVVQFMLGYPATGAFTVFLALANAACCVMNMLRDGNQRRQAIRSAHLPDYSLIARMEREIYGEAFSHDGAPEVAASTRVPRRTGTGTTSTIHFAGRPSLNGGGGGMSTFANMNGRDYCARCHDAWARHQ